MMTNMVLVLRRVGRIIISGSPEVDFDKFQIWIQSVTNGMLVIQCSLQKWNYYRRGLPMNL